MSKIMISILVVALISAAGCTDPQSARKALLAAGYSNVEITGYDWFACSKDDTYSTAFRATGPTGVQVEGAVCQGLLFKGSTIRTH
jgi:hypothetical protein